MRRVFADTGYWVALLNHRDELHQKAQDLSKSMGEVYIFTSEMVLAEVLNDFSKRGELFRQTAIDLIATIYSHPITPQRRHHLSTEHPICLLPNYPQGEWNRHQKPNHD